MRSPALPSDFATKAFDLPEEGSLTAPVMQHAIGVLGELEPFGKAGTARAFRDRLRLPQGHAKLALPRRCVAAC